MNHGDDSDHWVFYHSSIVKIGPIKVKRHIQCPIWVSISSVQKLKYLPVFVSIMEVHKIRVFWTANRIPSISNVFYGEPTIHWNVWHSALQAIELLNVPFDFWTAIITSTSKSPLKLLKSSFVKTEINIKLWWKRWKVNFDTHCIVTSWAAPFAAKKLIFRRLNSWLKNQDLNVFCFACYMKHKYIPWLCVIQRSSADSEPICQFSQSHQKNVGK